jgi:hypothetical protein
MPVGFQQTEIESIFFYSIETRLRGTGNSRIINKELRENTEGW